VILSTTEPSEPPEPTEPTGSLESRRKRLVGLRLGISKLLRMLPRNEIKINVRSEMQEVHLGP
jgi:hypothetical protein